MSDHSELQRRVEGLAGNLAFPPEPDIASSVRAAVVAGAERRPTPWFRSSRWRARLAPALAILLLAAVGLVLSPTTRSAIADWIGLNGLRIGFGEVPGREPGDEPTAPLGTDLRLGIDTTLDDAAERAGFVLRPPGLLGPPDEVYLVDDPSTPRISLVYEERPGLPSAPSTRVGALFGAFPAQLDHDVVFKKLLGTGTAIERVEVNGAPGYWITGDLHVLFYVDEHGDFAEEPGRLAGNTLAWEADGIVYRLESALSKARALAIARSVP